MYKLKTEWFLYQCSYWQTEGRGIKDPERLKRQQKRKEDAEKAAVAQGAGEGDLRVS